MKVISTAAAPPAIGPYSQAIVCDEWLFTSGQIPLLPSGELVSGGIEEQTHQVFKNLQAVLAEARANFSDVVKVTVYLKDMDHFQTVNEIYRVYFTDHQPARTAIEVSRLPKDVLLEIECVARIRNK